MDLIARLEAATEGSRELDLVIAIALEDVPCEPFSNYSGKYWAAREARENAFFRGEEVTIVKPRESCTAPNYTTSLDAAMTLIPELPDMGWDVGIMDGKARADIYWLLPEGAVGRRVSLDPIDGDATEVHWCEHARGATPAIALCIAALKASEGLGTPDGTSETVSAQGKGP